MKTKLTKTYLFIASLVMMLVGVYIAITTNDYMAAMTSSDASASVNMMSDLRGMGGLLLVLGAYVFVSVYRRQWWQPALNITTVVYLTFVIFRSLSFILDGLPDVMILAAYSVEVVLAGLGVVLIKTSNSGPIEYDRVPG
jgi:hypothetical protein